ncbi:polysaccharide deacetylase family protein [Salinimicrobium tongyeongense]|uniref:Polysaccharide deacetylase family protein n=1 Tax=Salinimicrobium tongyeongense TaxID=2809707 RepID=A0ABY6NNN6_9FLAO|nr:polysaccharide deacetylase family protein [Salinimicrobium tongyeongense]UZH54311.1 polysaccharide deacetylase family protein [Salinimicrobium tongyeongense]
MLLVYTQKITPRITYVFKHVCTQILGLPVGFTSKIEEFVAHEGMKLSYGKQSLANEVFIQNVDLLLEQGMNDLEVKVHDWDGVPCFFAVGETSSIPFDIFAASFYLLSRYEEYLPHVKDKEGRFQASESLAYQEGFLEKPVIDIWAQKFRQVLSNKFPNQKFPKRKFTTQTIVAVTEAYCYKKKGIVRVVLGLLLDLIRFKPKYVLHRLQVMTRMKKDPYDIYTKVIQFLKKYRVPMKFMFQVSDFSTYDRNINHNRLELQSLIKSVADYAEVGLQPGFYANQKFAVLKEEKKRLEDIIKRPVKSAINNHYNLLLPDTYNHMVELEFQKDFSMGYPEALGLRAGTCTPFLFYDLNFEITTPLLVQPYAINSEAFGKLKENEIEYKVLEIKRQISMVEGRLISVFTNKDFSEYANARRNFSILKILNEIQ